MIMIMIMIMIKIMNPKTNFAYLDVRCAMFIFSLQPKHLQPDYIYP